jgi:uncharacterized protein
MRQAIVDTNILVALFDQNDALNERCVAKLTDCHRDGLSLITTWPCVTEASYLLAPKNHLAMLRWFSSGGCDVASFEVADLEQMTAWMDTYSEYPKTLMDLADASLMWLAMAKSTRKILTEDKRDFLRYRLPDGSSFELL